MAVYMIGYDLHEGQDYTDLENAIKRLGDWWHCLDSTWMVDCGSNAEQIRDYLLDYIREDDRLLIIAYGSGGAWYGFSDECHNWLRTHL
jgi:hypothetical protein